MNIQDMMVFRHEAGSRTVGRYLMSHEERVIAVRGHPAVLLPALLAVVGGLIACALVAAVTGILWVWWLWLPTLGYLVWKVLAWSLRYFLVTEHRLMVISGVINREVAMMPLAKVEDIALERSVLGRMLGYGEFVIESAGDKQALRNVRFMPYPEQLYLEVSTEVFGAEDPSPD
ncbi:membrane protein [Actinomadura sp. NBRC 104425]|uniref:PH domain-containing protein n=1 Tax=Actinomadura sp. NBRC 104425 TaxID=3032204 RepID=UPI0024A047AF|nr:PH domain-containing protein [Actinomadura sp. NBRC 104425]GLZ11254.1 membrane protein [Actinomadura sp. NBRC 104425]